MTQQRRLLGMLTGLAMMAGGLVLLATTIGWIWNAFPSGADGGEIAAGATVAVIVTPSVLSTMPVTSTDVRSTATPAPIVTATFTDLTPDPSVPTTLPVSTPESVAPTTAPSATPITPTSTLQASATAAPPSATATTTIAPPTPTATVTLSPTVIAPAELTLETTPIASTTDPLTASRCASLDAQTRAGLYQVESPAQIGVEQRLCLGGFPITDTISVYLTGRSALRVALTDDDGNGYGYAEVLYVPTRADRNRPLNMTAAGTSITASGQITIDPVIPGVRTAPQIGTSFASFYTVLTFPDDTARTLYLYRRSAGDTFRYVRQILLLPQPDTCVPFNPCFASDISLSRESAGDYRFVEYSVTGGFRLFPGDVVPLGFLVVNPTLTPTPDNTPTMTVTIPVPVETSTPLAEATVMATPIVSEDTPTPVPTFTFLPSSTAESTATAEPTATPPPVPAATSTPIVAENAE